MPRRVGAPGHRERSGGTRVRMGTMTARVPIDRQSPTAYRAAVAAAKAVRQVARDAGLDKRLVELVNIRVSQINGCAACLDAHVRASIGAGEAAQRLAVLPAWRDSTLFTDAERAALALAESVTTLPSHREQDSDYAEARQHLTDDQLSAVAWVALTINAFNRISIVSGHTVHAPQQKGAAG
jgi:AhpD family alkylhydroperoxidase